MRNGIPTQLVPSMDGNLYQMDSEGIEPIPLAADLLLTSTYKLTDDSFIVGRKQLESVGLDADTGKVGGVEAGVGEWVGVRVREWVGEWVGVGWVLEWVNGWCWGGEDKLNGGVGVNGCCSGMC